MRKSLIKLKSWEFWPFWFVYIPVFFSWFYYAIKLKSFFFFTTVNPKIEMGGFAGESKMNILNQIPIKHIPKTILIDSNSSESEFFKVFTAAGILFPCVSKPDVGERGLSVKICKNKSELLKYFQHASFDFMIQDFVDYPIELAILYYRFPDKKQGKISSLCQKNFLNVVGNGKDKVITLIKKNDRAFLQIKRLEQEDNTVLEKVLKVGEKLVLDYIGNHSRGTIFLDKNHLIDVALEKAFDKLSEQIPDLHFGRYDLKCKSLEDLKLLKNFSILEINGISAEPAHIYQPGFSFIEAEQVLLKQWNILYQISKIQIKKGIKPMSFKGAANHLKRYKRLISLHAT